MYGSNPSLLLSPFRGSGSLEKRFANQTSNQTHKGHWHLHLWTVSSLSHPEFDTHRTKVFGRLACSNTNLRPWMGGSQGKHNPTLKVVRSFLMVCGTFLTRHKKRRVQVTLCMKVSNVAFSLSTFLSFAWGQALGSHEPDSCRQNWSLQKLRPPKLKVT